MKRNRVKLIVTLAVIGVGMGLLVWRAAEEFFTYDILVDDYLSKPNKQDRPWKVAGVVEKGSIKIDFFQMQVKFALAGKESSMPVSYKGAWPDNFQEEKEILAEGKMDPNGIFQASKIITKCETKYQAKVKK